MRSDVQALCCSIGTESRMMFNKIKKQHTLKMSALQLRLAKMSQTVTYKWNHMHLFTFDCQCNFILFYCNTISSAFTLTHTFISCTKQTAFFSYLCVFASKTHLLKLKTTKTNFHSFKWAQSTILGTRNTLKHCFSMAFNSISPLTVFCWFFFSFKRINQFWWIKIQFNVTKHRGKFYELHSIMSVVHSFVFIILLRYRVIIFSFD